jgi:hypothetical protein
MDYSAAGQPMVDATAFPSIATQACASGYWTSTLADSPGTDALSLSFCN